MHGTDARRLAARTEALGVVNGVAYNRRFDRGCLRVREILRAGGIGAVRYVQSVQLGYARAGSFSCRSSAKAWNTLRSRRNLAIASPITGNAFCIRAHCTRGGSR
jgi:predicted dehydrogenase